MNQWNARQLQVVWFSPEKVQPKARELFALLSSDEPTATQTGQLPTPMGNIPFEQAQGVVSGSIVNVQIQSNRVDLILQPEPDFQNESVSDVFRDATDACAFLADCSTRLNSASLNVNRIGIVANLVKDQVSQAEANRDLVQKLGFETSPFSVASDINLQANFPVNKEWGRLNRITRWSVETFRHMQIVAQGGFQVPSMGVPHFVSALMLDINTTPFAAPVSPEQRGAIISDAVVLIRDVWTHGDLAFLAQTK